MGNSWQERTAATHRLFVEAARAFCSDFPTDKTLEKKLHKIHETESRRCASLLGTDTWQKAAHRLAETYLDMGDAKYPHLERPRQRSLARAKAHADIPIPLRHPDDVHETLGDFLYLLCHKLYEYHRQCELRSVECAADADIYARSEDANTRILEKLSHMSTSYTHIAETLASEQEAWRHILGAIHRVSTSDYTPRIEARFGPWERNTEAISEISSHCKQTLEALGAYLDRLNQMSKDARMDEQEYIDNRARELKSMISGLKYLRSKASPMEQMARDLKGQSKEL